MAYVQDPEYLSLVAGADFSTQNYVIVQVSTAGQAIFPASAGGLVAGVITNAASSGAIASVQYKGVAKVKHDGTVTPGAKVGASTAGLATPSTGVDAYYLGTALTAPSTASGTYISLLIQPMRGS